MKKTVLWIVAFIVLSAILVVLIRPWPARQARDGYAGDSAAEYYTCPMHPTVVSDRPGACPVCGMALVRKKGSKAMQELPAGLHDVTLSSSQRVTANVSTVRVERRPLSPTVNTVGVISIAEQRQVTVAARSRGRIEMLHVATTGTVVKKGQPLFDFYSPDLVSAEREFLLAITAGGQGGGAALVSASRERLKVHFGLTERQIGELAESGSIRSVITYNSPVAGTVIQKRIQEGQYVDEGMTMYQLADLNRVWVIADIYEKDIRLVRTGQTARVIVDAFPGEAFDGRLVFIEPVLNPDTRTVRVRIDLPNPTGRLRPNMYVRVALDLPAGKGLVVPTGAVLYTGKRSVVWVEVEPSRFEPREVTVGATTDAYVEILTGLTEGEMVASTGGYLIDSESRLGQANGRDDFTSHQ